MGTMTQTGTTTKTGTTKQMGTTTWWDAERRMLANWLPDTRPQCWFLVGSFAAWPHAVAGPDSAPPDWVSVAGDANVVADTAFRIFVAD